MQEFLKSKKVDWNLMSLTGYRTLILLQLLLDSPKSIEEINNCFLNNEYIKEKFSSDTLRLYVNALREVGCNITKASKTTNNKYVLISHPFLLNVSNAQFDSINKVYQNIYDKISVNELINIKNSFDKIISITDAKTVENFQNISFFKNISLDFLNDLISNVYKKNQIKFLYDSPNSGEKEIVLVADKLEFKSQKLYLWGFSANYNEYSYFRVDRISKMLTVNLKSEEVASKCYSVVFKIKSESEYILKDNENLVSRNKNIYTIEKKSKNRFKLVQDLLFDLPYIEIISPEDIKNELKQKLVEMEAMYND